MWKNKIRLLVEATFKMLNGPSSQAKFLVISRTCPYSFISSKMEVACLCPLQYVFKHANLAFSLSILWRNPIQSHHFISHPTQGQPGAAICWNIVNLEPLHFSLVSYPSLWMLRRSFRKLAERAPCSVFLQNRRQLLAKLIFHLKTKNNTDFNFLRSQICLQTVRSHNSIYIYSQWNMNELNHVGYNIHNEIWSDDISKLD